jgi:hypothetical protein
MILRKIGAAAAVIAALTVSACEVAPPQQRLPQLTFSHLQPYRLDVGRVEIATEYQAPMRDPNVEHVMPVSPEAAAKRWVQDRLQPVGTSGAVRVVIRDARVVEVPLKTDKGFTGLFKEQQAERYDAALDLAIQVLDERNLPRAEIVARTQRSRTVPEGTTLNERDRIWFGMVEDMMTDLNGQLEGLIPQYLNQYLVQR